MNAVKIIVTVLLLAGLGAGAFLLKVPSVDKTIGLLEQQHSGSNTAPAETGQHPDTAIQEPHHLVLTHVMHQMAVGAVNNRNETHLSVEPTRANGILATHTPEYIANYGKPLAAARQDVSLMHKAGITTISLLLGENHLPQSQFAAMIHGYYRAAAEDGTIKIAPDIWSWKDTEKIGRALGLLRQNYEAVWQKLDGKYVVLLVIGSGNDSPPPYQQAVETMFRELGGRDRVYLVLYDPYNFTFDRPGTEDWYANADALSAWLHNSFNEARNHLSLAIASAQRLNKPFWVPTMPSFMQSRYPHPGITPNVREMLGMSWFCAAWQTAIQLNAPAVTIQTWNDLTEDSAMMPESNHGDAYYELGKYYIRWYHTGKKPEVESEQILLFHHPQIVEGVQLPAGRKPVEGFPVSHGQRFDDAPGRTPPTDYLGVVAMLKQPATVRIMLGETVLGTQAFPAGMTSWLLYQPRQKNDPRKLYPCMEEQAYPQLASDFLITRLDHPLFDAEVFVDVERGSERLGFFRSHRPVTAAAARGDLTTVGDAFPLR